MNKESQYKLSLNEIIKGYSVLNIGSFRNIYIRHFSFVDTVEVETQYALNYEKALNDGLPAAEKYVDVLIRKGLWEASKEEEYQKLPAQIAELKLTKSKFFLTKDIEALNKRIDEHEDRLARLYNERTQALGTTAEVYAHKRTNEFFVYFAFRKENLKDFYFSKAEFDHLDDENLQVLVDGYNEYTRKFEDEQLKKIAISSFFMNMIYIGGDEVFHFYGKPVVELTYRQMEVYSLGRYYKSLMSEIKGKPPEDVASNPDKLVDYVESKKTGQAIAEKQGDAAAISIVGATKEDLEKMGLTNDGPVVSLEEEARKKGGSLSMEDMIKLHGL